MIMVLGYDFYFYDNKKRMFENIKLDKCANCSDIYTINQIDPSFKIKTKKHLSSTYDGYDIVSGTFKSFCENENYSGLEFVTLPNSPGFYWFKTHNIIEYDSQSYGLRFINYNEKCQGYEEIIGASPVCLKERVPIPDGFFRTDICFGSFESKSPVILIGVETLKKLKKAGFKGIDSGEILDKYDFEKTK
ncbi:MAG TPA: hypothetical protein VFI29_19325 [Hanamia sp.]|nr:hypothetical protein [Hanamia sp.]